MEILWKMDPDVEKKYNKVGLMDPMFEKYCDLYTKDMVEWVGLGERFLSPVFITHILLNSIFGLEKRIVNSGLLTDVHYTRVESSK